MGATSDSRRATQAPSRQAHGKVCRGGCHEAWPSGRCYKGPEEHCQCVSHFSLLSFLVKILLPPDAPPPPPPPPVQICRRCYDTWCSGWCHQGREEHCLCALCSSMLQGLPPLFPATPRFPHLSEARMQDACMDMSCACVLPPLPSLYRHCFKTKHHPANQQKALQAYGFIGSNLAEHHQQWYETQVISLLQTRELPKWMNDWGRQP